MPELESYAAIGVTLAMVLVVAAGMLILAHLFGPRRHGPVKDQPYESGMPLIMDNRRRFHIRFYIVAVLFMLFDVEVIFMWPWAVLFYQAATQNGTFAMGIFAGKEFLLAGMGFFFLLLLFGLVYEWKKGALDWD